MRKAMNINEKSCRRSNIFGLFQQRALQRGSGAEAINATSQKETGQVSELTAFQAKEVNIGNLGIRDTVIAIDSTFQCLLNAAKNLNQAEIVEVEVDSKKDTDDSIRDHMDYSRSDDVKTGDMAEIITDLTPKADAETDAELAMNIEIKQEIIEVKVTDKTEDTKQAGAKTEMINKGKINKEKSRTQKAKQLPKRKLQTEKKKPVPVEIAALTDTIQTKSLQEAIQMIIDMNVGRKDDSRKNPSVTPKLQVRYNLYSISGNQGTPDEKTEYNAGRFKYYCRRSCVNAVYNVLYLNDRKITLLYLDKDGDLWESELKIDEGILLCPQSIHISKWRCITKLHVNEIFLQPDEELMKRMRNSSPYAYKYMLSFYECWHKIGDGNHYDIRYKYDYCIINPLHAIIMAPQLEQLDKIGFTFAHNILDTGHISIADVEHFNRLCQPGKNLKEIFKTAKAVYTTLAKEENLEVWDIYRKMEKLGEIDCGALEEAYHSDYTRADLKYIGEILARKYDGKNVFTWQSLQTYIHRLDFFEAIPATQALPILNDYMRMCNVLHIKPRIDSDSLRREHDVTARTVTQKRDEIIAENMKSKCEKNSELDYSEKIFMIRAIKSYDDLIDEAKQMHNCVASYAKDISTGRSRIYVMREIAHPDRSLITVELDGEKSLIRQKLLAYNKPIRNKAQTEFLERWLKHVRAISARNKA